MSRVMRSLRWMQNMERFATDNYRAQTRAFTDKESADKLRAATANERQHADDLTACLERLGGGPSPLGPLFRMTGTLLGVITTLLGKTLLFKGDVWIEKRAIRDYGRYLERVGFDGETVDMLRRIIEDEKRHVATWQSCIGNLKGKPVE